MQSKQLIRLCQAALLAALAVVLVYLIHFPLIPAAPYLEYDMADVPVLLATLLFGPLWGLGILAVVSLIQAFLLGGNGWVGCAMHFVASGALVLLVGVLYGKSRRFSHAVLGMVIGTIAVAALMIPLNLTLTVYVNGMPAELVRQMIFPAIVPFNLLKAGINCVLTAVLFRSLTPVFRRYAARLGI